MSDEAIRSVRAKAEAGDGPARRPRGRPRKNTDEALLDRAVLVFWRKGYEAASMGDLTEAMGVSRASFYNLFESKEALFGRVLDRYGETIGAEPARAMAGADDARGAVEAFLRTSLEGNTRPDAPAGCLYACCAAASAGEVPGVRERIAAALDAGKAAVATRLAGIEAADAKADLAIDLMNAQAVRARAGETRAELMAGLNARVDAVMATHG